MRATIAALSAALLALLPAGCAGAEPGPEPQPPGADGRHVVGYFPSWAVYQRDFQPADVAADRLTHLVYAFGKVTGGRCAPGDAYADTQRPYPADRSVDGVADVPGQPLRGAFGQLAKLRAGHPGLKVIWSFGGWKGSAGFTAAAADPDGFAASCRALVDDPRWAGLFDGIDVDWEYPNACGVGCDDSGRDALGRVVRALRAAFGPDRIVTAAVPADPGKLAAADYAGAAAALDWVMAMTYDFAGTGGGTGPTAPHSALTGYPGLARPAAVTDAAVGALRELGVPSRKILLGIGFYGRGWAGVDRAEPGGRGTGPAPGTYEPGLEDYRILAQRCPPTGVTGGTAYAFCDGQWWSYDTPATVAAKMTWAREQQLGGAFVWELSGDTADGDLLTAVRSGLAP
jgi:chitinase